MKKILSVALITYSNLHAMYPAELKSFLELAQEIGFLAKIAVAQDKKSDEEVNVKKGAPKKEEADKEQRAGGAAAAAAGAGNAPKEKAEGARVVKIPHTIDVGKGSVQSVRYIPNGQLLSCSEDGIIKIWDAKWYQLIHEFPQQNIKNGLIAVSYDGKYIAVAVKTTVVIWDMQTYKQVKSLDFAEAEPDLITALTFSHNNKYITVGFRSSKIRMWEFEKPLSAEEPPFNPVKLQAVGSSVTAMQYARGDQYIAMGFLAEKAIILDIPKTTVVKDLRHNSAVTTLAYSPDNKYIATGSIDNTVKVWNGKITEGESDKGELIKKLELPDKKIKYVIFSSLGKQLAAILDDFTVRIWNTSNWQTLPLGAENKNITSIAYSPDDKYIALGTKNGSIVTHNPDVIKQEQELELKRMGQAQVIEELAQKIKNLKSVFAKIEEGQPKLMRKQIYDLTGQLARIARENINTLKLETETQKFSDAKLLEQATLLNELLQNFVAYAFKNGYDAKAREIEPLSNQMVPLIESWLVLSSAAGQPA